METADYKRILEEAKADLVRLQTAKGNLEDKLNDVNAKIDAMTKTFNAIAPLVGEDPIPGVMESIVNTSVDSIMSSGISVAVKSVLDGAPWEDFTAAEVKDRLAGQGWKWQKYNNPQGTVYTTLSRLVGSGKAKEGGPRPGTSGDGAKTFYSANRTMPTLPENPGVKK